MTRSFPFPFPFPDPVFRRDWQTEGGEQRARSHERRLVAQSELATNVEERGAHFVGQQPPGLREREREREGERERSDRLVNFPG